MRVGYVVNPSGVVLQWIPNGDVPDIDVFGNVFIETSEVLPLGSKSFKYADGEFVEIPLKPESDSTFDGTKWNAPVPKIKPYTELRYADYPPISDQLDMLYHAMDAGEIPKATQWYDTIKAIKTKYPKG